MWCSPPLSVDLPHALAAMPPIEPTFSSTLGWLWMPRGTQKRSETTILPARGAVTSPRVWQAKSSYESAIRLDPKLCVPLLRCSCAPFFRSRHVVFSFQIKCVLKKAAKTGDSELGIRNAHSSLLLTGFVYLSCYAAATACLVPSSRLGTELAACSIRCAGTCPNDECDALVPND
eukprot:3362769-Rhodomonas_salina.1